LVECCKNAAGEFGEDIIELLDFLELAASSMGEEAFSAYEPMVKTVEVLAYVDQLLVPVLWTCK
jgi:hypothetical protein